MALVAPDVHRDAAVVQRDYDDEKRHLAYVKEALAARAWERAA